MRRSVALAVAITLGAVGVGGAQAAGATPAAGGRDGGTIVLDWNRALLRLVRKPGTQPATIHPTRSFAVMHAAIYDAVVSVTGAGRPYLVSERAPRGPPPDAPPAAPGHDTLPAHSPCAP